LGKLTLDDLFDPKYRVKQLNLLIDGDVYAHKASSVTDGRMYEVGKSIFKYKKDADKYVSENGGTIEVTYQPEPFKHCTRTLRAMFEAIESALEHKTDSLVSKYYLTGSLNFRSDILEHYKWNRLGVDEVIKRCNGDEEKARAILKMKPATFEKQKGVVPRRPFHLKRTKEYISERLGATQVDYLEADDLIGIEADRLRRLGEDFVIVSTDKDLNCIPGWHYNSDRDEIYHVSESEAMYNFYYQCLLGDKTDNIPGIPGVGEAKATAVLKGIEGSSEEDYYRAVLDRWTVAYGDDAPSVMLKSAQCLWILQDSSSKPIVEKTWQPPEMSKIDKTEEVK